MNRYIRLNGSYNCPLISSQPKQPLHPILHLRIHRRIPVRLCQTISTGQSWFTSSRYNETKNIPDNGLFNDKVRLMSTADVLTSFDDRFHHQVYRFLTGLRAAELIRGFYDAPSRSSRASRVNRQGFESGEDLIANLCRFCNPGKQARKLYTGALPLWTCGNGRRKTRALRRGRRW